MSGTNHATDRKTGSFRLNPTASIFRPKAKAVENAPCLLLSDEAKARLAAHRTLWVTSRDVDLFGSAVTYDRLREVCHTLGCIRIYVPHGKQQYGFVTFRSDIEAIHAKEEMLKQEPYWSVDWAHFRTPYRTEAKFSTSPRSVLTQAKPSAVSPPSILQDERKMQLFDQNFRRRFHTLATEGVSSGTCLQKWRKYVLEILDPILGIYLASVIMGVVAEYMDRPLLSWRGPICGLDQQQTTFWSRNRTKKILLQNKTLAEIGEFRSRMVVVIETYAEEGCQCGFSVGIGKFLDTHTLRISAEIDQDGQCWAPMTLETNARYDYLYTRFATRSSRAIVCIDFDVNEGVISITRDGDDANKFVVESMGEYVPFVSVIGHKVVVTVDP